jgi:O-antigen/teichoic acid export membrane protein
MSAFNSLRLKCSKFLGIDRAVFFAVVGKIWGLGAGIVTTLMIGIFFSPDLQGYYYTFQAVLTLQAIAELGLGSVLTYYASHEWANLALDRTGRVTGDADALSKLASLGRFALKWYLVASTIVTLVLAIGGFFFFAAAGDPEFQWKAPWAVLCVVTGLTLCVVPIWALLEGCNQVSSVYGYRVVQYVASSIAAWVAIYLGAGLWVASIIGAAGLLAMTITVGRRYGGFVRTILLAQPEGPRFSWRTDIWPMQWRIAMSWIGGYLIFSLFTPVLFHYQGPIVAGQMGMTWVLVGALMPVASSWTAPKAPRLGILIAQQKYVELDRMFWRITANVLAVTATGAVGIWIVVLVLNWLNHPFALRLLPPAPTAYMLLATTIVCATSPMSIYLRAHKREPLMVVSVVGGLLTGVAVVILGKYYSAVGVAVGYLSVMATMTPFVALIWYRRRAEWHAPAAFPLQLSQAEGSGAASDK